MNFIGNWLKSETIGYLYFNGNPLPVKSTQGKELLKLICSLVFLGCMILIIVLYAKSLH